MVKKRFSVDHYFKLGTDCLGRYYRNHKPFSSPVKKIEYTVLFKMDPEDDFQIKGIIDRLDHLGDGKWEIHDYKTSSRSMSQADANRNRQLALYQLGVQQVFNGVEHVELVWHFLQHGQEVRSSRSVRQLKNLKTKIRNLVSEIKESIQNNGPFLPQKSPLCYWCFYWEECPAVAGHNPVVKRGAAP
ncbi:MAG TPA: Dna2/Cas4 domain-containing protein [Candidatus Marinimicrobia bacterium]|nr:Dna2/Cas4 domain-containing protein [Candidatus Neomarinimicrobiota bacterium]HIO55843.1 Dna2/Cas4 domain-containing protein [Candidatus Neomarinimicrobiota bacterium]